MALSPYSPLLKLSPYDPLTLSPCDPQRKNFPHMLLLGGLYEESEIMYYKSKSYQFTIGSTIVCFILFTSSYSISSQSRHIIKY